jgi:hypothetical protein
MFSTSTAQVTEFEDFSDTEKIKGLDAANCGPKSYTYSVP